MKKLNPNVKYDFITLAVTVLLALLIIFGWGRASMHSTTSGNNENNKIKIESYSVADEIDLKLIEVHKVVSKEGKEYNEVEFNSLDGLDKEVIKCMIPINESDNLEVGTIYKANISYWYVKDAYEKAYKDSKEYDSIQEAVRENKLENYRQVKDIDFIYSQYITNKVTEDDMKELFSENNN